MRLVDSFLRFKDCKLGHLMQHILLHCSLKKIYKVKVCFHPTKSCTGAPIHSRLPWDFLHMYKCFRSQGTLNNEHMSVYPPEIFR